MTHGKRANGKAHGVVNTKKSVVKKMLDLAGYCADKDLREVRVLEPAAGTGAFALEIFARLYESAKKFEFSFAEATTNIFLCEIDLFIAEILRQNVTQFLPDEIMPQIIIGDFLLTDFEEKYDLIISNPPYVRHENIPQRAKKTYKKNFATFTHRSDLYIPFYEKGLNLLNEKGLLSYVCSNRWLKNQYGKKLRQLTATRYKIEYIVDLENADIFEEEVLGYPAVTAVSKNTPNKKANYYKIGDLSGFLNFSRKQTPQRILGISSNDWFGYRFTGAAFEKNLKSIEEQNFKIGIGVATGRDALFIGKKFSGIIEEELLLPLLKAKDVSGVDIEWQGNYLINPYAENGKLIDLQKYPLAKKYFNSHQKELSQRHTAKKNPTKWYKTIDRVCPALLKKPKVILPDISKSRFIHTDAGIYYPHHNLYYITGGNYAEMCLLAAVLMSDFVYRQLLATGNKMNGGYPRWQSQNLRKLQIPVLSAFSEELKNELLTAYRQNNSLRINELINENSLVDLHLKEEQLALF